MDSSPRACRISRSQVLLPLLEEQEDATTKPWRLINHSFPDIGWIPDIPWNEQKIIRQQRRWKSWGLPVFEWLREETGTKNYRIFSFLGPARLFRIHMNPSKLDLMCRKIVTDHLENEAIFDRRFLRCLKPLLLRKPTNSFLMYKELPSLSFKSFGNVWLQLFPYAHGVEHYNGKELSELENVADALGRVQASLQGLAGTRENGVLDKLRQNPENNPLVYELRITTKIQQDWEKILKKANEQQDNDFARILSDEGVLDDGEKGELTQWVIEASKLRNSKEKKFLLLHDIHPHNVFCKEMRCVLIYDYTWIGDWTHSLVLAFSVHRFVREYAIKNAITSKDKIRHFVRRGTSSFLKSYEGNPRRENLPDLPSDFRSNLKTYIRCSNIEKLLGTFEKGLGITEENRGRSLERQLGEARKFVRFMKEAEEFSD